jgi:hypothetical protein
MVAWAEYVLVATKEGSIWSRPLAPAHDAPWSLFGTEPNVVGMASSRMYRGGDSENAVRGRPRGCFGVRVRWEAGLRG